MGPAQVQSSPFLLCSVPFLCLTRSRLFVSVIPAVAGIVPLPSCSMLAAASSAVVASVSLLPVASWAAPSLPAAGPGFADQM